jgi:hypothetical protein
MGFSAWTIERIRKDARGPSTRSSTRSIARAGRAAPTAGTTGAATMGDFNRDWAYARAHPECRFEGDPIEFYRGLTAELDSAIESR